MHNSDDDASVSSSLGTSSDEDDDSGSLNVRDHDGLPVAEGWEEEERLVMEAVSNFRKEVFPLLQQLGVSFSARDQTYTILGSGKLETEEGLRSWMLHNGIPNMHWLNSMEDKRLLTAWVRYTHVKRSDLDWKEKHELLEETVARIFRTKLETEDTGYLPNYRAQIWKFGITDLHQSATVPVGLLRKLRKLAAKDRSPLRLWAARGGFQLPVHLTSVSTSAREQLRHKDCPCASVSPLRVDEDQIQQDKSFRLRNPPARIEIWPTLKVLGWTNQQHSSLYQLPGVCDNGCRSIEEVLGFMAHHGIPNAHRLEESKKEELTDLISFRHVEYEEVKNAENSFGGLDPSVFDESLQLEELHSFLGLLGFKLRSTGVDHVYHLDTRMHRMVPMSLYDVRNMLRLHGFSKCRRVASSSIRIKRQKLRCQIWAAMAEAPLPYFREIGTTTRKVEVNEPGDAEARVARSSEQLSGDNDAHDSHSHHNDDDYDVKVRPGKHSIWQPNYATAREPKQQKVEEEYSSQCYNPCPGSEQRLQQMRLYNDCLRRRNILKKYRNDIGKNREQALKLWRSASDMATAISWEPLPPKPTFGQLPEVPEVMQAKVFNGRTIPENQALRDALNVSIQNAKTCLDAVEYVVSKMTLEVNELSMMFTLKQETDDDCSS